MTIKLLLSGIKQHHGLALHWVQTKFYNFFFFFSYIYMAISPSKYKAWNEPAAEVFQKQVLSFWSFLSSAWDWLKASPPQEVVWSRAWVLANECFLLFCFHWPFPCKLRRGETPALLSGLQWSHTTWMYRRLQPVRAAAQNSFRHHPSR